MRKIKFRVWDRRFKYMHICGESMHDSMICLGHNCECVYYNLQNGEGSVENGDYVLMQYTGLKDKNEKEIYEGDIIKYEDVYKGVVEYSEQYAQYVLAETGVIKDEYEPLADYNIKVFEVIGNIYENSELLEENQNEKD